MSTCAQDSQSGGNIVGRDVAALQLLMQVCQLVCGISACIGLPRSHVQDSPHLRNHPGLPGCSERSVEPLGYASCYNYVRRLGEVAQSITHWTQSQQCCSL